jgi:hypothetical protein
MTRRGRLFAMGKGRGWRHFTNVVPRFCPAPHLGLCWFPMRGMLFTLIWVACSVASATQVYKWVDEKGVTHYSDQPHENAAKVDVREPQTYSSQRGPPVAVAQQPASSTGDTQSGAYQSCSLAQPTPDQVFLASYSVTVTVNTVPSLRPGDRVIVTLDGRPRTDLASSGTSITISPVDRGTHSVEVTIQDPSGRTVCQSASNTFHVRQPTVNRANH